MITQLKQFRKEVFLTNLRSREIGYRLCPPVILDRLELGDLLNAKGLIGEGAEIGVKQGEFSTQILSTWTGKTLHSIDPWSYFDEGNNYIDIANVTNNEHERFFSETKDRLTKFGERSRIHRSTSLDASKTFTDASLDFCYIDAQHHYEAVREDIKVWAPKVRSGGILAGHDYVDQNKGGTIFGVKRAVDEWAVKNEIALTWTREDDFRSWIAIVS